MKEEQFDYIENRIREAAKNSQPVFEETAWGKMEALLDKDKKRRPFLWLWLLLPALLIGSAAVYFINRNNTDDNIQQLKTSAHANQQEEKSTVSVNKISSTVEKIKTDTAALKTKEQSKLITGILNKDAAKQINSTAVDNENAPSVFYEKSTASQKKQDRTKAINKNNKMTNRNKGGIKSSIVSDADEDATSTDSKMQNKTASINMPQKPIDEKEQIKENDFTTTDNRSPATALIDTIKESADTTTKKSLPKSDTIVNQAKEKTTPKERTKTLANFYLFALAGADNANVKLLSFVNCKTKPKFGIGIGYQFNKRISIQSGFYISDKKYIAGPNDYSIKDNPYLSNVHIIKIDGNCKVYEIPLAFRYNVLLKKTISYFATLGISSYIMKKEDYDYHYTRYNTYYSKEWAYTGNQHLFSVLTIAAGIEKKLSEKLYLQVEPAIAIPLAGVGEGKVKLYSSSLSLGLKYFPFKKK